MDEFLAALPALLRLRVSLPVRIGRRTIKKGTKVYGRRNTSYENKFGLATGALSPCQLEGCSGVRVYVKWPGGKLTKPCSRGLVNSREGVRIE